MPRANISELFRKRLSETAGLFSVIKRSVPHLFSIKFRTIINKTKHQPLEDCHESDHHPARTGNGELRARSGRFAPCAGNPAQTLGCRSGCVDRRGRKHLAAAGEKLNAIFEEAGIGAARRICSPAGRSCTRRSNMSTNCWPHSRKTACRSRSAAGRSTIWSNAPRG